ncbi:dynein axonemal intermediate chain 4 isoform X2 [Dromaius novaehollandiae]|uniref:dynein axonemal intermediate chain 4 isoform X2 n=1 Tax=Dromaius novaehollandiae TaxID=8790 RepID=UPI00311E1E23
MATARRDARAPAAAMPGPGGQAGPRSTARGGTSRTDISVKGSTASSGSQRQGSVTSGTFSYRTMSQRRQFTTSESRAVDKGSLLGTKHAIQVFDDEGKDVTPRPLFQPDPSSVAPKQGKLLAPSDYSGATGSVFLSSFSMQQTSGVNISLAGPFSRSYGSSTISRSYASTTESIAEDIVEPGPRRDTSVSITDVQVRREETKEQLTKEDLDRIVDIYLTETETIWIFDMPSVMVSVESEDAGKVLERNRIYVDMCKNRLGNERFVERMMQTLNGAPKSKEVQCDEVITEDKGVMVTSWDLYDSFNALEVEPTIKAEGSRATIVNSSISLTTIEYDQTASTIPDRDSTTSSIIDSESAVLARIHEEEEDHSEAILKSEKFLQDLFFMERILMENVFQPKLAAYRQLPVLIEPVVTSNTGDIVIAVEEADQEKEEHEQDEEEQKDTGIGPSILSNLNKAPEEVVPPSLQLLWSYTCDLTNGHSVSSMAWNKLNPDLLAVGYGEFDFKEQKSGLVCCWSLKNPMWPERVFQCEHGVTTLDFSMASPNLLAVGMYNGIVAIYNVQSRNNAALLDSSECLDKHIGPVWQLKWVEQDRGTTGDDKGEILISISADGRITKWLIRKGLGCSDLMKIKRTESEKKKLTGEKERKSEALISRQAPGMCFDFHPKDTNFYLAGTEEGLIHKCSCSNNEQFLETYRGHKGPVYKIAWNPFSTDVFLSCSTDWSIILWHQDSQKPILTFSSTAAIVHDIMWSPKSVFIFVAVNESRIEIWDLSISTLDPLITRSASPQVKFTSVLFAKNTDCLLVGDSKGQVSVFELQNLDASKSNKVDALQDIIGSALAT